MSHVCSKEQTKMIDRLMRLKRQTELAITMVLEGDVFECHRICEEDGIMTIGDFDIHDRRHCDGSPKPEQP